MNAAPSSRIHEYIRAAGGRQDDSTMVEMFIPPKFEGELVPAHPARP